MTESGLRSNDALADASRLGGEPHDVLAVSATSDMAPAFRVRLMIPGPELDRLGVKLHPIPLFNTHEYARFERSGLVGRLAITGRARLRTRAALKRKTPVTNTVVVLRQADILPDLGLERLAIQDRRLVYDLDDAIWNDRTGAGGHFLAALKGSGRKARWLASRADHVIAANQVLADRLAEFTDRITIVPSLVEHRTTPVRQHREGDEVAFGWIGSRSTLPFLLGIWPILAEAASQAGVPRMRLIVVGDGRRLPDLPGVVCESLVWSPQAEREALARFDVGLMPVPDNSFTRGKSSYKAVQYMAAGVPVIADDVGVSAAVIREGGIVLRDRPDWIEAITLFSMEAGTRASTGQSGRRRVENEFSVTRWAPTLAKILSGDD